MCIYYQSSAADDSLASQRNNTGETQLLATVCMLTNQAITMCIIPIYHMHVISY